jgi:hypothetical protein
MRWVWLKIDKKNAASQHIHCARSYVMNSIHLIREGKLAASRRKHCARSYLFDSKMMGLRAAELVRCALLFLAKNKDLHPGHPQCFGSHQSLRKACIHHMTPN